MTAAPATRSRWKRWVVIGGLVWLVLGVIGYAVDQSTTPDEPEFQEFEDDPFFEDF